MGLVDFGGLGPGLIPTRLELNRRSRENRCRNFPENDLTIHASFYS